MNEHEASRLKYANSRAIELERHQGEEYSDDEMIRMIEHALKPTNRNRPCLCGSGKNTRNAVEASTWLSSTNSKKEYDL